ncbi:oxidoreductase [Arcanobacterium buesumense]|uniref:Oxidoreductase n=1 Tax=Arcanobacterium buesumense TaxID=2722751 RepID=A0A6H2EKF8_9ACTO|nr:oxidoreductase [Arcanobacterium buesumense]QJC21664.1 oxidoreductase [Arcanobacterium buesumense]
MAWFFKRSGSKSSKKARQETVAYLRDFCATRQGVEAYFELETPRDPSAILLVAEDGEWTRRKVPDIHAASELASELGIPLYDVARTGYPRSMREWNLNHPGASRR